jgi:arylsulfatase A
MKRLVVAGALLASIAMLAVIASGLLDEPPNNPVYEAYPPNYDPTPLSVVNTKAPRPNIIIINCDDLGYRDLGCFGSKSIRTPNIDRLATGGVRFTNFYASNSVCTPSRASLLTGRYPQRSGMTGVLDPIGESKHFTALKNFGYRVSKWVLIDIGPGARTRGFPKSEITIAEALKTAGYRTGMIGKWHLGDYSHEPDYSPLRHGFDFAFGLPHSNDMAPFPLFRNEQELDAHVEDQAKLTGLYTREALAFIEQSRAEPFFLYLAHTFPHQPLFASERFRGKSRGGLYGDTVEEIDWSTGEILECLKKNGLAEDTLIFFTSDNGPWFEGDPGHQRGRKGQSYEGGFKVPMIVRYPKLVPAGTTCDEPAMNIDLFPTLLALAGVEMSKDRIIDGKDMTRLLSGKKDKGLHEAFYFYHLNELEAIRVDQWKYIRKIHHYVWPAPIDKPGTLLGRFSKGRLGRWPLLYDLELDPGESYNLIDTHPEVGQKLLEKMTEWEEALRQNPRGWTVDQ